MWGGGGDAYADDGMAREETEEKQRPKKEVTMGGKELVKVDELNYLGSKITANGKVLEEMW